MENLFGLSKKAMKEELLRGRDMANQLLEVLSCDDKSNKEVKGSMLSLIAQDLVGEVLKSLTNTLLLLNNKEDSNDVGVPITVGNISLLTNFNKMEEDLDGSCKKLKTLNTKNLKGSNKRKSIALTWEKNTSILIDDGHTWRKYGQKKITNAKYFRSYYRCTHMYDQHCEAMKHVQRTQENPPLYKTTYYGHHSCKSSFHSDITFESILSSDSDSNSILLNFDNNIPCKQEYSFWSPSSLPPLVSTKGEPMEVNQVIQDTDHLAQNQLVSSKNLLLCDFDVYFDYLRHATMLSSTETVELENVCSQFGF
ncbi:WRKY DNA-binding transcription factor 70-like [Cicer arietinum]|uniref:WRKY DNA-binding transcription factor 70-like n=1 Tax=Cicer arietinum TaxID=3827 RepID=A0A1S2XGM5_CICAR|nr:WRKY DNA-binding transcription factor 70-like [Cicer arietinum]